VSPVFVDLTNPNRILTLVCSLPGADRIAIKTGAIVVGNGEAINVLRAAGVPERQLVPVSGGERVPLFPGRLRQAAVLGEVDRAPGPPGAPPQPDTRLAVASVHIWPSLHCLMPGNSHADVPEVMDTGKVKLPTLSSAGCSLIFAPWAHRSTSEVPVSTPAPWT